VCRAIGKLLLAVEVIVPNALLVPVEPTDQGQCFGDGSGFRFFGPLEMTPAMCPALGVGHLGIVPGVGGIRLIAIAQQRAGEGSEEGLHLTV